MLELGTHRPTDLADVLARRARPRRNDDDFACFWSDIGCTLRRANCAAAKSIPR
jgi:hypothetical protein